MKCEPYPVVSVQSNGLPCQRQYWYRRITEWRAHQYSGSADYGTERYRAPGNRTTDFTPVVTSTVPIGAVSRFAAAASPVATTSVALRCVAGARAVITAAVVCAASALIVATVATRRRLIRAARIRSVLSLGGPLTGSALRDALCGVTGDQRLEVHYRLQNRGESRHRLPKPYRGAAEKAKPRPAAHPGRNR